MNIFPLSNYDRVKLAHAVCVLILLSTITYSFSWMLLLSGLIVSWLFYCFGLAISLHKYSSHRTFEPKNRFIKLFLLWAGNQVTMGSSIAFAAGHRQHHVHSDTEQDPYYLDHGIWHKIKLFFYWFPEYKINPMVIKDLIRDPDHSFFNKHYWKITLIYPLLLALIDPVLVGYFYAMPVVYVLLGMGYVTVIAHLPNFGGQKQKTEDNSWNSRLFGFVLAGEGLHNNHHATPGNSNYEHFPGDYDPSGRMIEYLKRDTSV